MSAKRCEDTLVINTIRTLSIDAVQQANSGHPGAPMGMAPVAFTLWDRIMKFDPAHPNWANRDRFVLSVGHASALLYATLHVCGFDIPLDDIKNFRQLGSKCAGHPEYGMAPGIETTTGPLGQGAANSVGMAIAERWLADHFNRPDNKIVDYNIFAMLGDGCMMEGITSEAASLAGHLELGNLIWIYDSNSITIEGSTDLAFTENVGERFRAYGWRVEQVDDANDVKSLTERLGEAKNETSLPTLVIVKSHIAYGSPNKQDSAGAHGAPLGEDEVAATKKAYGWDPDKQFFVPEEVAAYRDQLIERGSKHEAEWQKQFDNYRKSYPDLAREFELIQKGELPEGWSDAIPDFTQESKAIATRAVNGKILNALASKIPWFIGGSADLGPSNATVLKGAGEFQAGSHSGRNLHFGVREHAMGAIANGLNLSGMRSFVATFLIFADYLRPSIRLAALMGQPVIYVFTHDSIGVGEDGPTHQPVEHLAALRAIPNLDLVRPADATELAAIWKTMMPQIDRPTVLALTRQGVPIIDRSRYAAADGATRGAYVLADCATTPQIILIGTGSEVQLCLEAYEQLTSEGVAVRVVSMPSWELFDRQDANYREEVFPTAVTARVAVEAGVTMGWEKYVGNGEGSAVIGIDRFGESAPASKLFPKFGFTVEAVVKAAKRVLNK